MPENTQTHALQRMFAGLTEHAFLATLGVADPPLVDYVSGLLSRFVHCDSIYRLKNAQGQPLTEITSMSIEAEKLPAEGRTRREYHRHIGDYALFWTGLFPEAVQKSQRTVSGDHLISFTVFGKRSYLIASQFEGENYREESDVLRRLSEEFELCAFGLHEIRKEWTEIAQQTPLTQGLIH